MNQSLSSPATWELGIRTLPLSASLSFVLSRAQPPSPLPLRYLNSLRVFTKPCTRWANWLCEISRTYSFMCQSFRVDVLRSAMWAWGWAPLYCLGMLRGEKEIKNFNSCLAQQSIGKGKENTEFIKQIWITCGSWRQTNPVIKEACINYTRVL